MTSLTPVGDYLRKRYPPNDGATHYLGNDGDPGCCAGPHPACLYDVAFREGSKVERERIWSQPVIQRLELCPDNAVLQCAGCEAPLIDATITHLPRCSETGLASLIGEGS